MATEYRFMWWDDFEVTHPYYEVTLDPQKSADATRYTNESVMNWLANNGTGLVDSQWVDDPASLMRSLRSYQLRFSDEKTAILFKLTFG